MHRVGSGGDFRLGGWLVQPAQCRLSKDGRTVQVRAKVMDLLAYLASRQGDVVSKDQLLDAVWESLAVSESALTHTVAELRQAIGDAAEAPQFIETIPKRGYRLIGRVEYVVAGPGERGAASTTRHGDDTAPGSSAPHSSLPTESPAPRRTAPRLRGASSVLVLSLVASLAALFVVQYVRARVPATVGERTRSVRSIAVLPFEDLSGEQADVQYADGLTEALITELSTLEGFDKVIGRQSVARFRAAPIPLRDAARALDVDALVTASVLRSAGRLRVTARLVDGATERHLWAATYERSDGDVLLIQRSIVDAIAGAVKLALGPEAVARQPRARRVSAAAFDAYIAGRRAAEAGPSHYVEAVEHFETATALDPEFARAHAALAAALWEGALFELPARHALATGQAAAARAIALDPNLGEAHAASGLLALHADWDWGAADAALRRAIALTPNSVMVRQARVHYLVVAAHYAEAIDEARRSVELEPSSYAASVYLAWAAYHARRYDESVELWRLTRRLGHNPDDDGFLAIALAQAGRADELRTHCEPGATSAATWRCAQALALAGDGTSVRLAIAKAPADLKLLQLAEMHAAMADATGTVRVLERAYDARDSAALFMNAPAFDPVRHDQAFRRLQRRMNYPALAEGDGRFTLSSP